MKPLKIFQIDAFTTDVFRGNPAAVVPLEEWLTDTQMQSIATENNLAETAFFVPEEGGYGLRWFTPTREVPLCGHATLASAYVIFNTLDPSRTSVEFQTLSGLLTVRQDGDLLAMDFPRYDPLPCPAPPLLLEGLQTVPTEVLKDRDEGNYYAVLGSEQEVCAVQPDLAALSEVLAMGVAITAVGDETDFVSRYFAPRFGIPEDPVTGSTHCTLAPYWARRLGKARLHARQVSLRGGDIFCEDKADRVTIAGQAVQYLEGHLFI